MWGVIVKIFLTQKFEMPEDLKYYTPPIKEFELEIDPLIKYQNDVNNWIVNLGTQIFVVDNEI